MEKLNLTKLDLARLHNAEFGQLLVRFFEDLDKKSLTLSTDEHLEKLIGKINSQMEFFQSSLNQFRASEESKKILLADKTRNEDFKALNNALKPYRKSKIADEKNAYDALSLLMNEYKGTNMLNYEEETSRLNSLLQTLKKTNYQKHTQTLLVGKFVTRLEQSNNEFNQLFSERSSQTLQKVSYNVIALRKSLAEDYKKLATYVEINFEVSQNEFYKDVLLALNNGRNYFASVVLSRRKESKTEVKEEKK